MPPPPPIPAGLDYLSWPTGPILRTQQRAAATWGAGQTWLLVNGTTAGVLGAVLSTCAPGDALLLARNCHLSAFNAMALAGATPVWLSPCADVRGWGVAHHVTPAALEAGFSQAVARGLKVGAALVVSPTYFGVSGDLGALAAACHARGVPLLVDEAHGAHLGLDPGLPPSAVQLGADLVVQSTHKQLSAMTQAAMLHLGPGAAAAGRVDPGRVSRALQAVQSSSPSYILMASLDAAAAQAAQPGALAPCLAAARWAREQLARVPGIALLALEDVAAAEAAAAARAGAGAAAGAPTGTVAGAGTADGTRAGAPTDGRSSDGSAGSSSGAAAAPTGGLAVDPLRLVVSTAGLGLSGYEAAAALEQEYGVVAELAASGCVVLACSIGTTQAHAQALVAALQDLSQAYRQGGPRQQQDQHSTAGTADARAGGLYASSAQSGSGSGSTGAASISSTSSSLGGQEHQQLQATLGRPPEMALTPRQAFFAPTEVVPFAEAAGRAAAELLCPYPPGVPAVMPGERITPGVLALLAAVVRSGGKVMGASDETLATLRVVASSSSE